MEKHFVTYEIALKLKELGFNEECLAYYTKEPIYEDKDGNKTNFVLLSAKKRGELVGHGTVKNYLFQWLLDNDITHGELHTLSQSTAAPLWQQVIDWFRESKDIHIAIHGDNFNSLYEFTGYVFQVFKTKWNTSSENIVLYSSPSLVEFTYNNAREQAILKAIELIKEK